MSNIKIMLFSTLISLVTIAGIAAEFDPDVDISNPARLMFVSDQSTGQIDILDIVDRQLLYRIDTQGAVDHIMATPYAPVLVWFDIEKRSATFYNLREKEIYAEVELPVTPRHVVLNTTGTRIGITDNDDGGFVLLSAYTGDILIELEDFPATADVLFDPNEIDIYYTNNETGSVGLIDENTRQTWEMQLTDDGDADLSSPSRSLDGGYIYVANNRSGEVYSLNAYAQNIFHTFDVGASPVRPYTTPEGYFLYMMDRETGRFQSVDQYEFKPYIDLEIDAGIDLVTVGRFDRMNLFLSSENPRYHIFDNTAKKIVSSGELKATPLGAQGSVDGRTTWIAFADLPEIAAIDLETFEIEYFPATTNGASAYTVGLSNNVCH